MESPEEVGHVVVVTHTTPPTDHRSPPPDPDPCLIRTYASRPKQQKGGTLIAEDVQDLDEHERRMRRDSYRPDRCPRCGAATHAHEHRSRVLAGEAESSTEIAIYRCADRDRCGAVWRVLPGLLARHLWRAWRTVARGVTVGAGRGGADERPTGPEIPPRTRARWRGRLMTSAALIVAALATALDVPEHADVVTCVGYAATRGEVVAAFATAVAVATASGRAYAALAGVVHRLVPGARLV